MPSFGRRFRVGMAVHIGQRGNQKGGGFARAGLGFTQDITALERITERLCLDRRAVLELEIVDDSAKIMLGVSIGQKVEVSW